MGDFATYFSGGLSCKLYGFFSSFSLCFFQNVHEMLEDVDFFWRADPDIDQKINPERRELSTVRFSAFYDLWRPKKSQKTKAKKNSQNKPLT